MRFLFSILFSLAFSGMTHADDALPGPIPAEVVRVVDGDTIRVRAHVWVDQIVMINVRLLNIDTPEIGRAACPQERAMGLKARDAVQAMIGETIALRNIELGTYAGRVLAEIETEDGIDLGAALLERELAVIYRAPKPWCAVQESADLLAESDTAQG